MNFLFGPSHTHTHTHTRACDEHSCVSSYLRAESFLKLFWRRNSMEINSRKLIEFWEMFEYFWIFSKNLFSSHFRSSHTTDGVDWWRCWNETFFCGRTRWGQNFFEKLFGRLWLVRVWWLLHLHIASATRGEFNLLYSASATWTSGEASSCFLLIGFLLFSNETSIVAVVVLVAAK